MKKKSLKDLNKEIAWLKRDKYNGSRTIRLKWEKDVERLRQGEPLDYVIGWKEFLGCKIDLSQRPLIPREETEYWLGEFIGQTKKTANLKSEAHCLDLFAGSGCIGISLLKHFPQIHVIFGEKDPQLSKQIKKNLRLNKISSKRAKVLSGDLFKNIHGKFDYIFANPPYIPTRGRKVQSSVSEWEPAEALWAGIDGLHFIRRFLREAKKYLKEGGKIYLEFGYGQKGPIEELIRSYKYKKWSFHRDQFGKYRLVVVE